MPIAACVSDFDGTLADEGKVSDGAMAAVRRLRASGRKFLLATGRRLDDLKMVFPGIADCDLVVAENGAVLYWPADGRSEILCPEVPQRFIQALYEQGVPPLAVGVRVVAMLASQAPVVERVLVEQGLDLGLSFNKDSLMILPKGIDKGSGTRSALSLLGIRPSETVAIGDAENDEPLFAACAWGAAVANAVVGLRAKAGLVLQEPNGRGVITLIDALLDGSLDLKT